MGLDTFTRRAIAIGALMAGAAIFYHYVIFIPSVERTKQAQLESDKKEAELRVTKKRRIMNTARRRHAFLIMLVGM